MPERQLTLKETLILDFLHQRQEEGLNAPTYREIYRYLRDYMEELKFINSSDEASLLYLDQIKPGSPSVIQRDVKNLRNMEFVKPRHKDDKKSARAIVINEDHPQPVPVFLVEDK